MNGGSAEQIGKIDASKNIGVAQRAGYAGPTNEVEETRREIPYPPFLSTKPYPTHAHTGGAVLESASVGNDDVKTSLTAEGGRP